MSVYFADTSAIVKRYISTEIGSVWIKGLARRSSRNQIAISELTVIEVCSAIARRQRENLLTTTFAQQAFRLFLSHTRDRYAVIQLDSKRVTQARKLVLKHPLRSLDTIQLACALEAKTLIKAPIIFLSSDNKLLTIAATEGFAIDNPLSHP